MSPAEPESEPAVVDSTKGKSLPSRKKSFVHHTAKWSDEVSPREERYMHMDRLLKDKRDSMKILFPDRLHEDEDEDEEMGAADRLTNSMAFNKSKMPLEAQSEFVRSIQVLLDNLPPDAVQPVPPMEIRLMNFSFKVPSRATNGSGDDIATVATPLYKFKSKLTSSLQEKKEEEKLVSKVLSNVNLVLKPGKMYLVLGPPQSGKTSLLKAIGCSLPQDDFPSGYNEKNHLTGQVVYNNLVCCGEGADSSNEKLFKNLVAFVGQRDIHAPRLTVGETFVFSGCCKDEFIRLNRKGTCESGKVGLTLKGLGLSHVKDTFVGNEQIRGVSGGQRRRVTLGEMLVFDTPLLW
jgi:energy-coupling factor transporter ATP-binding protein EcfA2